MDEKKPADTDHEERWTRKDLLLCVLFLVVGSLVIVYAVLAMKNRVSISFWGLGFVVGPALLFIGGNGIYRSMHR